MSLSSTSNAKKPSQLCCYLFSHGLLEPKSSMRRSGGGASKTACFGPPIRVPLREGLTLRQLTPSASKNCAFVTTEEGRAYCWSLNKCGTLGKDQRAEAEKDLVEEQPVKTAECKVKSLVATKELILFLSEEGVAYTREHSEDARADNLIRRLMMPPPLMPFFKASERIVQIASGYHHCLLLSDLGHVYSFGKGSRGQLGTGSLTNAINPTRIQNLSDVQQPIVYISAGYNQSFAVDSLSHVYSFGMVGPWLGHRLLSLGGKRSLSTPKLIESTTGEFHVKTISVGKFHTLMLTKNGHVYSMGKDYHGSLGHAKYLQKSTWEPQRILELKNAKARRISAGVKHSAVLCGGHVFVFGNSVKGSTIEENNKWMKQLEIPETEKVVFISSGYRNTVVVTKMKRAQDKKKKKKPKKAMSTNSRSSREPKPSQVDKKIQGLLKKLKLSNDIGVIFMNANVSYKALRHFDKDDLKELGIPLGARLAIWKYLRIKAGKHSDVYSSGDVDRLRPTIDAKDLVFVNKLGTGAFGDVWEGRLRGAATVAIKTIRSSDKSELHIEAQIMSELPAHPNVVTFYGLAETPEEIYLLTEFIPDGSLDKYLQEHKDAISIDTLTQITKDVVAGMDHLTAHGVVHRDLATRNLLLEIKRGGVHRVKVCDFGLSRSAAEQDDLQIKNVPVRWTAPEVFKYKRYTKKSDVWSFGVTVWEIFSFGQLPYSEMSIMEVIDSLAKGYILGKPSFCPDNIYKQVILPCLSYDPDERPSFNQIYWQLEQMFPSSYTSLSISLSSLPSCSLSSLPSFSSILASSSSVPSDSGLSSHQLSSDSGEVITSQLSNQHNYIDELATLYESKGKVLVSCHSVEVAVEGDDDQDDQPSSATTTETTTRRGMEVEVSLTDSGSVGTYIDEIAKLRQMCEEDDRQREEANNNNNGKEEAEVKVKRKNKTKKREKQEGDNAQGSQVAKHKEGKRRKVEKKKKKKEKASDGKVKHVANKKSEKKIKKKEEGESGKTLASVELEEDKVKTTKKKTQKKGEERKKKRKEEEICLTEDKQKSKAEAR